jgi:endonuclease YncB( thermonuclease family)
MFLWRLGQLSPVRGSSVAASGVILLLGVGIGTLIGPALSNPAALRTVADAAVKTDPAEGGRPTRAAYPAQVLHVNDGDTFEARVSVWPGLEITTKVRLRGIDAPELRSRCADELAKAQAARDALLAILSEGAVGVSQVTLDKYGGRVLAEASTRQTPDVSAALIRAGLARSYAGGKRESWC